MPSLAQGADHSKTPQWAAPELDRAVVVLDGRTGERLSFEALLDALAVADAVFLGETHIDETTHRVELGVYEGLVARRGGKVVLAMEMFDRDVQGVLNAYLEGSCSEEKFLAESRPWTNYDTGYKPLIEFAKTRNLPVVGSNFPKPLGRKLARMGAGATLDSFEGEARKQLPQKLFANSPAYWRRVDNAVRGHIGMMGVDQEDVERLYSTQSLWDNSMGEACAIALEEHPGNSVLHVNGGFHSAYWDGTVRQLKLRKPDAKILTVAIVPTANPGVVDSVGAPYADYIVYAEARATDLNEGTYSVFVQREVKYRLHMPEAANSEHKVPLLIWFGDDGFTAEDGMALWRSRLGEECAIVVVEAPYRETQDDLVEGGRWFWPDTFASDLGSAGGATEKIWAFLLRHYPIDPDQVCVAGEGTGATVAAFVSLTTNRVTANAVAISPRHYSKLKDIPLPLPEFRGDNLAHKEKYLRLLLSPQDEAWWSVELAEYQKIGFDSAMVLTTEDPWMLELEREAALRVALGLDVHVVIEDAPRRHILATSPRARLWARLLGAEESKKDGALFAVLDTPPVDGVSMALETDIHPENYQTGGSLPRCPGPFGGTTVLILPEGTPQAVADAWFSLEANDPLNKRSRFHRLRVATVGGARDLPVVLAELHAKGRKNVLLVPAVFCADGETMRTLRKSTLEMENQMTLWWQPGLGG